VPTLVAALGSSRHASPEIAATTATAMNVPITATLRKITRSTRS
jgi:hypothetical protein